jgi:hypothetical protein
VRAVRATAWFVLGWLCCFGQGLFGSKLHSLWTDFVTWQGASREQRAQWRRERRLRTKTFDVGRQ